MILKNVHYDLYMYDTFKIFKSALISTDRKTIIISAQ